MEGVRRRFGPSAGTFLATTYLRNRREELELSFRQRFGRGTSSTDEEAQESFLSEGPDTFNDEELQGLEEKRFRFSLWTRLVLILSSSALAANLFIMIGLGSLISSISGAFVAALVGVAQLRLEDMETLREVHNMLRKDVNRFCLENIRLGTSVDELTLEVDKLALSEQRLKDIAERQNCNSQSLVELVRENRLTLDEMKEVLRDDIVADLMDAVFRGEKDLSGAFSDAEIRRLLHYMRGLPAVSINEDLLLEALQRDRSIVSLMQLVRDIGIDGVQEGDKIFTINEQDRELQSRFINVS